jgi:prepilin-type processing-associated H-X9-DG protein
LHNYHDTFKSFPPARVRDNRAPEAWNSQNISYLGRILPFIEQTALNDQVDFEWWNWYNSSVRSDPNNTNWNIVAPTVVPTYRCPSDGGNGRVAWVAPEDVRVVGSSPSNSFGHNNYCYSIGNDTRLRSRGRDARGIALTCRHRNNNDRGNVVRMADIVDGTSNTVAVSEMLIGFPRQNVNSEDALPRGQVNNQQNGCPVPGTNHGSSWAARGNSWFRGYHPSNFVFTTLMTPNSELWDCGRNSDRTMYAARSRHPGGVQATMCDGSVHFFSETIDFDNWAFLGGMKDGVPVQVEN